MMTGKVVVLAREGGLDWLAPCVEISVAGGDRVFHTETAVVDTGFTGWLAMPGETIERLGLTPYGQRPANQASGDVEMFDIHSALVLWHDALRAVPVHRAEGTPLIGMSLLSGSRLIVDSWEGGDVVIEEVANAGQN